MDPDRNVHPSRPVGHSVSERGPLHVPPADIDGSMRREVRVSVDRVTEAWLEERRYSGETLGDAVARHLRLTATVAAKAAEIGPVILHMRPPGRWWSRALHNCLAHPLLILCPPLGEWLHERTEP